MRDLYRTGEGSLNDIQHHLALYGSFLAESDGDRSDGKMKRWIFIVCVLVAVGCHGPPHRPAINQTEAMRIVTDICNQRCSEFKWVDEHGHMSVKGKTKEPYLPIDDLIRDSLEPHGWTVWIPTEDYFDGYSFRIGIKTKDPNTASHGTALPRRP
jgi:hypothetical protein